MLSDRVAQKPIIAVNDGMKTGRNSPKVRNLPGWESSGPRPLAFVTAHHTSTAVMTSTNGAEQIHAAVDDVDVEAPEQEERQPLGGGMSAKARAKQHRPAGNDRLEE